MYPQIKLAKDTDNKIFLCATDGRWLVPITDEAEIQAENLLPLDDGFQIIQPDKKQIEGLTLSLSLYYNDHLCLCGENGEELTYEDADPRNDFSTGMPVFRTWFFKHQEDEENAIYKKLLELGIISLLQVQKRQFMFGFIEEDFAIYYVSVNMCRLMEYCDDFDCVLEARQDIIDAFEEKDN